PKLLIVPSAHNFSEDAIQKICQYVENTGATLLWTGPLGLDEYWKHSRRLQEQVGDYRLANVLREEVLNLDGKNYPVSFGDRRIGEVNKEVLMSGQQLIEAEI